MAVNALQKIQEDEQFKAYLLKILIEDDAFAHQLQGILLTKKALKKEKKTTQKAMTQDIAYTEMPYWKMHTDFKPRNAKPYAIKKETIVELQKEWKDAPPVEELIAQLTK